MKRGIKLRGLVMGEGWRRCGGGEGGGDTRHGQWQTYSLTSSKRAKWTGVESVRSLKNDGSHTVQSTHLSKPMATTGNLQKIKRQNGNLELNIYRITNTVTISQYLDFMILFLIVVCQLENVIMLFKEIISCKNTLHSFFKIKFKPWSVQFEKEGKLEISPVWEISAPATGTQCSFPQQRTDREHISLYLSMMPKQGLNGFDFYFDLLWMGWHWKPAMCQCFNKVSFRGKKAWAMPSLGYIRDLIQNFQQASLPCIICKFCPTPTPGRQHAELAQE